MALSLKPLDIFAALLRTNPTDAAKYIHDLLNAFDSRVIASEYESFRYAHAGDGAAGDARAEVCIGVVRAATTGKRVRIVFAEAVTADDTNYASIVVKKRAGAGAGTATTLATATTKITGGLGNITAHAVYDIVIPDVAIEADARVTLAITKSGTGVDLPEFTSFVETLRS